MLVEVWPLLKRLRTEKRNLERVSLVPLPAERSHALLIKRNSVVEIARLVNVSLVVL